MPKGRRRRDPFAGFEEWCSSLPHSCVCFSVLERSPLFVVEAASKYGHLNCVKIAIEEYNADVTKGESLYRAVSEGHTEITALLLSKGADVSWTESSCESPLSRACRFGYLEIVKLLVENGADVEVEHVSGSTPLMEATSHHHLEIVRLLLDAGAKVNKKDEDGNTAVHMCVSDERLDMLKMLLEHGGHVMEVNHKGNTPLFDAALERNEVFVEYLTTRTDLIPAIDRAIALELLGSLIYRGGQNVSKTVEYWKNAISLRYIDGVLAYPKEDDHLSPASGEFSEVSTLHQLEEIENDLDALEMQSILVMERILGPTHGNTKSIIRSSCEKFKHKKDIKKCVKLWIHAIDVLGSPLKSLDPENRYFHYSYFYDLFSYMFHNIYYVPCEYLIHEHFKDIFLVLEKCKEEIEVICSMPKERQRGNSRWYDFVVYLVVKSSSYLISIRKSLGSVQWKLVEKAVRSLVNMDPRNYRGSTLLHLACPRDFFNSHYLVLNHSNLETINFFFGGGGKSLFSRLWRKYATPLCCRDCSLSERYSKSSLVGRCSFRCD